MTASMTDTDSLSGNPQNTDNAGNTQDLVQRLKNAQGKRFENLSLKGLDLAGAQISDCVFQDCNLQDCNLSDAQLVRCTLSS
ncbi:MAG: pentapeptide repeat-containing protein, partial [Candidatus Desulfovibrio faecigallinarum]|nr:pentapeptide repeat-containing protein [Candidatus Desulfovibrio faecigallinarum]